MTLRPVDPSVPLPRRIWWPWTEEVEQVTFAQRFYVTQPGPGLLALSAGGLYWAALDGKPLPIPETAMPSWRAMHRLTVQLPAGEHILSVSAQAGPNPQPFLLASLDWTEDGQARRVATGADWKMTDRAVEGTPDPSAAGWRAAWAFDGVWAEPWGLPCDAPDDYLRLNTGRQEVVQTVLTQVVETGGGYSALENAAVTNADGSLTITPVEPYAAHPPRVPLERPSTMWHLVREVHSQQANTWLQTYAGRAPFVVFDAGAETFARVVVCLKSGGPAVLALTTGESLAETHGYIRAVTDVITLRDGECFATTPVGFRFLKLTALGSGGGALELAPIELQHLRFPVDPGAGSFQSSDPLLDDIWRLSARTVHLCMQSEIWDGIKRDQLPWMGDLYVEALAAYACFGETSLARRTLAMLADLGPAPEKALQLQRAPGLQAIWKRAGGGDINGIPTYTMWWVVGLYDYWLYSGDTALVQELAPELAAALEHIVGHVGKNGLWMDEESRLYVDWAPLSVASRYAFSHLLATHALLLGSALLDAGDQQDAALRYRMASMEMAQHTCEIWCDGGPERLMVDSRHHVPAMAIRSGVLATDEAQELFAESLAADEPLRMTYWHRYADLEAAALTGNVTWGLAYLRRHWGPAVQAGVTALWEASEAGWLDSPDPHAVSIVGDQHGSYGGYRTSLCHGWSAGGAAWLQRAVLGVTPAAPGFAILRFQPDLGDLDWAEGVAPTPRGPVTVRLERRAGQKPLAQIDAPAGVQVQLADDLRDTWDVQITGAG